MPSPVLPTPRVVHPRYLFVDDSVEGIGRLFRNACSLSADASVATSVSIFHTVRVWDMRLGELRTLLRGHRAMVRCTALSQDGDVAASASEDGTVRIWDACGGEEKLCLRTKGFGQAFGVALTPDGQVVIGTFRDGTAKGRVVMCTMNSVVRCWTTNVGLFMTALSSDASVFACVWENGRGSYGVDVVESETGRVLRAVKVWPSHRPAIAMDANGAHIIIADDKELRMASVASVPQRSISFPGYQGSAGTHSCAVTADCSRVVASVSENRFAVWDVRTTTILATLEGYGRFPTGCPISASGTVIIAVDASENVCEWNLSLFAEVSGAMCIKTGHQPRSLQQIVKYIEMHS